MEVCNYSTAEFIREPERITELHRETYVAAIRNSAWVQGR